MSTTQQILAQRPLILTTCLQFVKCVKFLLDKGAFVNKTDNRGYTVLLYATQSDNAYLVEVLLKSGSDPSKGNTSGIIPVQVAVENTYQQLSRVTYTFRRRYKYKINTKSSIVNISCTKSKSCRYALPTKFWSRSKHERLPGKYSIDSSCWL